MSSLPLKIAILAVFYFTPELRASELKPIVDSHHFPGHTIFTDSASLNGTSLLYLVCPPNVLEQHCKLTLATHDHEPDRHCNVTLKNDKYQSSLSPQVMLMHGNKSLVIWHEPLEDEEPESIVKFMSVHLDSCRTTETKFQADINFARRFYLQQQYPVAVHDNDTDFIFKSARLCGDKQCKVTLDADGKTVDGPVVWYPNVNMEVQHDVLAPIEPQSSNGLLMIKYGKVNSQSFTYPPKIDINRSADVFLVGSKEFEGLKELKKYSLKRRYSSRDWRLVHSTAHETIGICTKVNSNATCTQFGLDGKEKLEATVNVDSDSRLLNMHNLPNGGYLLLSGGCQNVCTGNKIHYHVTRVNASGQRVGSLKLTEFQCDLPDFGYSPSNFYEEYSEDRLKNYCVSIVCLNNRNSSMGFFAKCFSDKHLSS